MKIVKWDEVKIILWDCFLVDSSHTLQILAVLNQFCVNFSNWNFLALDIEDLGFIIPCSLFQFIVFSSWPLCHIL